MKALYTRLWEDESGQGLTEYVLIIALVAIGLIAVMVLFRDSIGDDLRRDPGEARRRPRRRLRAGALSGEVA